MSVSGRCCVGRRFMENALENVCAYAWASKRKSAGSKIHLNKFKSLRCGPAPQICQAALRHDLSERNLQVLGQWECLPQDRTFKGQVWTF